MSKKAAKIPRYLARRISMIIAISCWEKACLVIMMMDIQVVDPNNAPQQALNDRPAGEAQAEQAEAAASEDVVDEVHLLDSENEEKPKKQKWNSEGSASARKRKKGDAKKKATPKGKKCGKKRENVESEDDAKKAKRDKEEHDEGDVADDPEDIKVRQWRHKLQKTFLSNKGDPKEEARLLPDACLLIVEAYQSITIHYFTGRLGHSELKNVYDLSNIANTLADGGIAYPNPSPRGNPKGCRSNSAMFHSPTPEAKALGPPYRLIVMVGSNGSSKSVILKLLSRFYDPTTGPESILVDGILISRYQNVGLGYAENVDDAEIVERSAQKGGASHCLKKLKRGKETRLSMDSETYGSNLPDDPYHTLQAELDKLQKNIDLSGGETRGIAA
ncbi:hypothetical protein EV421DRAFT_1908199 [Armillaria borealis]|uniref:ABC transporter domain-containing protein n=1 Tax=Armillaria borealis TaxID=47425 RepID=A0AA39J686_9AGAR|nr:hypothetical protein EV421DRAFT_1908199 [Armillaria borealis]